MASFNVLYYHVFSFDFLCKFVIRHFFSSLLLLTAAIFILLHSISSHSRRFFFLSLSKLLLLLLLVFSWWKSGGFYYPHQCYIVHYSSNAHNQCPLITQAIILVAYFFTCFVLSIGDNRNKRRYGMWQRSLKMVKPLFSQEEYIFHSIRISTRWHLSIWPEISIHIAYAQRKFTL